MSIRIEKDEIDSQNECVGFEVLKPRVVKLTTRTEVDVRRTLPHKQLRMIGAWCFVDHYGPTTQVTGMTIGAHPHVGLQTVTWLFDGRIMHNDSLGTHQEINPAQLNLMTAGRGIAHSEQSLEAESTMHGVQLWIALPDETRKTTPLFEHFSQLPTSSKDGITTKVFVGQYQDLKSPAKIFSDLVGAEFKGKAGKVNLDLNSDFEYGVLNVGPELEINGHKVGFGELAYTPVGQNTFEVNSQGDIHFLLLGGKPFGEKILMWWNFIGRTHEEIVAARELWNFHNQSIPDFADEIKQRIPAPELPNLRLTAR
ncbi:MAG: pirin family protein [Candidatus Nanopelagicaceae bacterium]|nr:pirin family protein [Candidatus Nanopelagicaceae bacterium]